MDKQNHVTNCTGNVTITLEKPRTDLLIAVVLTRVDIRFCRYTICYVYSIIFFIYYIYNTRSAYVFIHHRLRGILLYSSKSSFGAGLLTSSNIFKIHSEKY